MKNREIIVGKNVIGDGHPVFIIAEIGINHNGSVELAKKLIKGAKSAGCNAVNHMIAHKMELSTIVWFWLTKRNKFLI